MMSKQQGIPALLGNMGVVSVNSLLMRLATSSSIQAIRNACWSGRERTPRLEDAWKALNLCFHLLTVPRLASKDSLSGFKAITGLAVFAWTGGACWAASIPAAPAGIGGSWFMNLFYDPVH